jgi:predicted dehydrogenase
MNLAVAVASTIAGGRIGTPVFARYILHSSDTDNPEEKLEQLLTAVRGWLPLSRELRYAVPDHLGQQVSVLVQSDAALALVAVAPNAEHVDADDVTVLGTRGAIYLPVGKGVYRGAGPPPTSNRETQYGVLLVAGCHTHQEDYAHDFASDPRCRIVAVTDEQYIDDGRKRLNEQLAASLGVPYLADLDAALWRADVHIVSICAEPERRGRIAVRCAEAGKHLYLDKPIAPRLEEALAIADAVRNAGVRSQMFSFVTTGWARNAKRLIDSGKIGEIRAIHADTFFAKGHAGTVTQPQVRREEYPPERHQLLDAKRELDNIGVYPITLVRWLTGREFASIRAHTANFFFAEHEKHNVEDFGVIAATLDNGTPVTIAAGRIGWLSHPAGGMNRLVLVGSLGTFVVDGNRPRFEVFANEPPWTPPPPHPDDPMAFWTSTQAESGYRPKRTWIPFGGTGNDVQAFLDALDADRESDLPAEAAAKTTEVLLAAYKSAATEKTVFVTSEGWRQFVSKTAGSISDPTFKRHEQGKYEQREDLP